MKRFINVLIVVVVIILIGLLINEYFNANFRNRWDTYYSIKDCNHIEILVDDTQVSNIYKGYNDKFISNITSRINNKLVTNHLEKSNVTIKFLDNDQYLVDANLYYIKNNASIYVDNGLIHNLSNDEMALAVVEYKGFFKEKYMLIKLTDTIISIINDSIVR